MASETFAAWILTVAVHASVLLGIAWLADRGALRSRPAWRETLWRAAFFGAVVTASVQVLVQTPTHARIALATRAYETPVTGTASTIESTSGASNVSPRENAAAPVGAESGSASSEAHAQTFTVAAPPLHGTLPNLPAWHLILIAGWLAGAMISLARLGIAWLRLRRSVARAEPVANASLATDIAALAIHARIAPPALAALDDLTSPIAVTGRRILLPTWAVELLDRDQLRAMLAHETAHIARRDPEWKLGVAAWCALFWFVPLASLARRRLDEIAEISCDAWAAIHLGDGRSLAECLAECAERGIAGSGFDLAPAMASRESPLLRRIDYLIAGVPMNTDSAGARAGFAAAAALAIAAFVLPGVSLQAVSAEAAPPAPPAPPAAPAAPTPPAVTPGTHIHISSDSDGKHDMTIVSVSDDHHNYNVKVDGKITFTDAEDDIASLSSGGSAAFSEKHDGMTRRIEVANRGGKLERRYFVDDKEQPFDAAAHAWMATLVPTVIRETAIDADGRVKRIRAKGGANAVLDEIARIDSGYARGVYIKALAASGKLSQAEMTRALTLVDRIDSDYEKRNALVVLGALQPLDASQQKLVLAQASKIDSDYERAELLVGMLPHLAKEEDVRAAWLKAALGIKSDYEHRRALTAMLAAGVDDENTLRTVVDAAESIGSDYERRELLVSAVQRTHDAETLAPAYAIAAGKIGSDYERREALLALIRAPGFGKVGARSVLDALAHASASYDCREVLVALAGVMPNDADLIERYRAIARKLTEYDRGEAERALDRFAAR
jgi:bla regulator protein blaR1